MFEWNYIIENEMYGIRVKKIPTEILSIACIIWIGEQFTWNSLDFIVEIWTLH